ncbi:hypothetical protein MGH68_14235 [Erysipelothrix sp. D19-032]
MKDFPTMTVALQCGELDGFVGDSGTGDRINATNKDLMYIQLDGPEGYTVTESMVELLLGFVKMIPNFLVKLMTHLPLFPVTHKKS